MKKLLRKKNGEWFTIGRKGSKVLLAAALTGTAIGGGIYYNNQHSDQLDQKQTQESKQQNNSEVSNDNTLPVTDNPITNNFESQVQPNENVKTDLPNIVSDENLNSTTRQAQAQAPVEETKPVKSVKHIAVKTVLPFKTITKFNPKLPQGTTNVIQEGKDGYKVDVYEVVSIADVEKDKTLLSTNIEKPIDKIVEIGTMKPEQPGTETPEKPTPEQPGTETPEKPTPEQPGTETPEKPTPEQPGTETPEKPTPEQPGTETPEKPTPEQPGTETPEKPTPEQPGTETPEKPTPEQPGTETPEKPTPEQPGTETPEKPTPEQPGTETPEKPTPEQPGTETPEKPTPEQPGTETPEKPTPEQPGIETPEKPTPEQPGTETPEKPTPEQPGTETPEKPTPEQPGTETPEKPTPEQPGTETPEKPTPEQPGTETPEKPTPEQPGTETPEKPTPEQPGTETPEKPTPEQPGTETPEKPTPEQPGIETPEKPTPEQPGTETPEKPTPEQPGTETPEKPTPEQPGTETPEKPTPEQPGTETPEKPTPEQPGTETPEKPTPEQPGTETPEKPTPEQPGTETPEKPTPEQPGTETPEKPTPEQPGTETPEKPTPEQPGTETPEKPTPEQPGTETPEKPTPEQPGTETPEKPGTNKPSEDIDWSNKAHFVINESEKKDLYDYYGSEEVNKVLTKLFGKTSGNITIEKYKEVMSNPELKKIFDEYQLDFVFKINDPALFNKEINDYAIKNEKEINKYFIELVNKARAKEGLKPVISASDVVFKGQKVDYFIQENANTRAKEMADYGSLRYKGVKSGAHKRPDGRSWYTVYEDQNRNISNLSDFRHNYAGENAAEIHHSDKVMISNPKQAIESIFAAWMASPGHRDLIMEKEDNLIFAFSYRQGLKDYLYPESNSKPTVGILHVSKWSNPLRYATNREKYEKFIKENPDSPYASKEYQDFLKDHLEKTK